MMKLLVNKTFSIFLILLLITCTIANSTPPHKDKKNKVNWKKVRVLVYTKNGKGFIHDNIANAAASIQKLGQEHGFKVDVSDKPEVFTEDNLKQYTFLLFPSTNNDVFDTDAQRLAFRKYIEAGGGFVGLHSVTGTERNWTWFKMMVGGTFSWHVPFMPFKIKVLDPEHPSMAGIPTLWDRNDECYFTKELYPGIKVLMAHDTSVFGPKEQEQVKKYGGAFGRYFPAVWYQHFDGGTVWVTTLGHDKGDYQKPEYIKHIFQGMEFVASKSKKLDFSKAYATSRNTPLP